MKRLIIIMALALAAFPALFAQTETAPQKPETELVYEPIRKGDQYIRIAVGPSFPVFILGPSGANATTNMKLGGAGYIGYSRFITKRISLGGEVAFAFNQTLAENLFFYVPLTFKASYEFVAGQFRFPCNLITGFAFQTYNSVNYFGPILKPEVGAYYQFSPEWSFGLCSAWNAIPQIYKDSSNNRTGNILDVTVGFRYHF